MTGKEFAAWMDSNGVSNQEAADLFGVSEQNIYNWRSTRGVPPTKLGWVRTRMADHEQSRQSASVRGPRETRPGFFEIFATDEELHRSDRASRLAGAESLAAWCHDVILAETDRALAAEQTGSSPALNPVSPHSPPPAGTAAYGSSSPGDSESEVA